MALPPPTRYGILPTEMEYVAGTETLVDILPLISLDRVRLLSGTYGPFQPPTHAQVPLWLAVSLRKKRKCVIIPPAWLSVDALTEFLRQETTQLAFAPLPLHYVAISKMLLEHAAEDIPASSRIRALLKDLRETRQSKVLAGLEMLNPAHLEMTNISSMEICEVRPFFQTALNQLHAIQGTDTTKEEPPSQTIEDDGEVSVRRV
ncbi:dna replication complex gins protein psf2 [Malassezia pachydermatis]|uniref:DNA replication complex GINS protein PSF2 n=1 Tax=Malassezia pachydermatis TaxID=77020 RepID=A0A0M8MNL4_9BASI|nr:dna replication complex gins protein psf2 [Malassezia pachydermatis]KOS15188.1 dna replication complex gins protein psf2 [Malassezia pachydermatis]